MRIQQIASGNPSWFAVADRAFFAPNKCGYTNLKTLFAHCESGGAYPLGLQLTGSVRDPFVRWYSVYNQMVLNCGLAVTGKATMINQFGAQWTNRWFPDQLLQQHRTVDFAAAWLKCAAPELEAWGGDLHFASLHTAYTQLLGDDYCSYPWLDLIDVADWNTVLEPIAGHSLPIYNQGVYSQPIRVFKSLRSTVYQLYWQDVDLYRKARCKR